MRLGAVYQRRVAGRGRPKAVEQVRLARDELYRKLVLDAAERTFAEHGFEAAPMAKVAELAGLSVGTLYGLYARKTELYDAVHEARGGALIRRVSEVMAGHELAVDAIECGIEAYVRFYEAHPDYLRMQLREGTAWAMQQNAGPTLQGNWRMGLDMVASIFARGIAQGAFVEHDAERMAKTLTAIHQVQLAEWVERGMTEPVLELVSRLRAMFRRLYCR